MRRPSVLQAHTAQGARYYAGINEKGIEVTDSLADARFYTDKSMAYHAQRHLNKVAPARFQALEVI